MYNGEKGKAQRILYEAFEIIRERTGKDPMEVFEQALKNVMPMLEVKARRVGGSNYQVPVEVKPERRTSLGLRWLVNYARLRGEKTMQERLASGDSSMLPTIQGLPLRRRKIRIKWPKLTAHLLTIAGNCV